MGSPRSFIPLRERSSETTSSLDVVLASSETNHVLPTSGRTLVTSVLAAVKTDRMSFSVVAAGASRNMMVVCSGAVW